MSIIVALSVQSLLMFIRGFNEHVTITTYPQLIPLILVVIHTLIRRKWPNLVPFFILHIISSAAFFCAVVFFPGSEYGSNVPNMIYLGVTVIALMIS